MPERLAISTLLAIFAFALIVGGAMHFGRR
jgi:hypothetical protein